MFKQMLVQWLEVTQADLLQPFILANAVPPKLEVMLS